jgi:hypothetical protein
MAAASHRRIERWGSDQDRIEQLENEQAVVVARIEERLSRIEQAS